MPNWTDNTLVITGTGENLNKLLKKITTDDSNPSDILYNFTNCFPKPEVFEKIHQGSRNFDGVRVSAWFEDDEGARPIMDITKQELIEKYGTYQPVDWEYINWGTKWGDCDTELLSMEIVEDDPYAFGKLVFAFSSAWGEPFRLLNDIAKKYNIEICNTVIHEFETTKLNSNYPWTDEDTKKIYKQYEESRIKMIKMIDKNISN